MSNRDHLERNIERLLRAVRPELELPEDKKEEILANLAAEAAAISSKDSAGPSPKTVLLQHPVKLAAAAVLIIGICAGAIWLWTTSPKPKEQLATQPKSVIEEITPNDKEPDDGLIAEDAGSQKAQIQGRLRQVAAMFDTGNIRGLTTMLSDEAAEVQIAAANYLAQIGDFDSVGPLLDVSKEWTGSEEDNPFVSAIYQIMMRISRQQAKVAPEKEQQETLEPVKFEFKPRGVISGLITEAKTGEPISNVKVEISKRRVYSATTDLNGFYYLDDISEDGSYRIKTSIPAYLGLGDWNKLPIVHLAKDSQVVKHLTLDRACQIEIKVVNELGEPVKDVRLTGSSLIKEHGPDIGERVKTDDEGIALLGGFEPADTAYLITAMHAIDEVVAEPEPGLHHVEPRADYAPAQLMVKLTDPEVIECAEIVLKKGLAVKGYAEYADGVNVDGLKIIAYPDWWHSNRLPTGSIIDPNGYFIFEHIVPGTYSIRVSIPEGEGTWAGVRVAQTNLPPADGLLAITLPMKSPASLASISGIITFAGNERPDSIEISASSPKHGYRNIHVPLYSYDRRDRIADLVAFTVDSLEPGDYTLRFQGSNLEEKVIENVTAPSNDLQVQLQYAAKPTLRGFAVRADTGKPVERYKTRARKLRTLRGANYVQADRWYEFDNIDGSFDIEAVGPGVYQVQIAADGFAWAWSEEINTDENKPVTIELTRGGAIKGRVINEAGEPISMAKVIPLSKASGTMPRVKDVFVSQDGAVNTTNGEFLLELVAAGSESIKVTHPDYTFAILTDIEVFEGKTTENVEIVLTSGGTVEGYVYDIKNQPQPNVTLYFQDSSGYGGSGDEEAGRLATVVTNAAGFYRATGLPEKMCHVRRSNSYSSLGVVRRVILPANGKTLPLDFGGKPTVSGQVIINKVPLTNNKVLLGDVSMPHFGVFKCYAMTDNDGQFTFAGAPLGRYAIYYDRPQKQNDWAKIIMIDVGTEDIDTGVIGEQTGRRIFISIDTGDPNITLDGVQIYLQEQAELWGQRIGSVEELVDEDSQYAISNVPPGTYTVCIMRTDRVTFREEVELKAGGEDIKVLLNMGRNTAKVLGQFVGDSQQGLVMWRQDKKVMAYIIPDEDGTFKIENLPPGQYSIGGNLMYDKSTLATFDLIEGQTKTVDLDISNLFDQPIASLHTMVISDNGIPLSGADVWLEGATGEIDPIAISSNGQFFLAEPGDYILHAAYAGYKEAITNIYFEAKDITATRTEDSIVFIRLEKQ